jgi:hypothetical protein
LGDSTVKDPRRERQDPTGGCCGVHPSAPSVGSSRCRSRRC